MTEHAAAGKLVSAIDENDKHQLICLCATGSPSSKHDCYIVARPGTPWWNALRDAEPGEYITVQLPSRKVHLTVTDVEELAASLAA